MKKRKLRFFQGNPEEEQIKKNQLLLPAVADPPQAALDPVATVADAVGEVRVENNKKSCPAVGTAADQAAAKTEAAAATASVQNHSVDKVIVEMEASQNDKKDAEEKAAPLCEQETSIL